MSVLFMSFAWLGHGTPFSPFESFKSGAKLAYEKNLLTKMMIGLWLWFCVGFVSGLGGAGGEEVVENVEK